MVSIIMVIEGGLFVLEKLKVWLRTLQLLRGGIISWKRALSRVLPDADLLILYVGAPP